MAQFLTAPTSALFTSFVAKHENTGRLAAHLDYLHPTIPSVSTDNQYCLFNVNASLVFSDYAGEFQARTRGFFLTTNREGLDRVRCKRSLLVAGGRPATISMR